MQEERQELEVGDQGPCCVFLDKWLTFSWSKFLHQLYEELDWVPLLFPLARECGLYFGTNLYLEQS